ncbi:MAG: hypothetical protein HND38_01030 [Planctomycetes bacterium]|nr:hypothetical protein [Planctomycetota bacterium]
MKLVKRCLGLVCIMILGVPALSGAFDIQLTQEQMKEANEYGGKYKGKDIFDSPVVKPGLFWRISQRWRRADHEQIY